MKRKLCKELKEFLTEMRKIHRTADREGNRIREWSP